jgi:hypothetical protein
MGENAEGTGILKLNVFLKTTAVLSSASAVTD